MPYLRINGPGPRSVLYTLHKNLTSLGSSPQSDVRLDDPTVPDAFAHIQCDGTSYSVATLTRKLDLVVNGKTRRRHRLAHGDRLAVGSVELEFHLHDPTVTADSDPDYDPIAAYERLNQFSARLMASHDVNQLLEELMDAVIEVSGAQKGFLILTEGDGAEIRVARNLLRDNIANAVAHLSDSILARVRETKQPLIISDAMRDAQFQNSQSVMNLRLTSVICAPLLDQGELLGLIYLGNDSVAQLFAEHTLRIVTVFAAQASLLLKNALLLDTLRSKNRSLEKTLDQIRFGDLIGASPAMQRVFQCVDKVAATDVSVLISGETGTGKELIAREIHRRSERRDGPFVAINCGAIPEPLLESELFGHKRGAFTGAVANQIGRFQSAHGGTLFLDEIGEMPENLQVKLLRVIQDKMVAPVGDTQAYPVDIRILSATHRNLDEEIKAGRFREDLYYRLNVVHLTLPALREREGDIVVLARYFLSRSVEEYGALARGFSNDALQALRRHAWPGNIRELENRIRKAVVMSEGPLMSARDLDLDADQTPKILPLAEAKEQFQRRYINEVLNRNGGNRTQTARDLGVDPRTIFRHLEKDQPEIGKQ
jgi:transcriptional regulator with GAF, ATPase, and Fis domain